MISEPWTVDIVGQAKKADKNLSKDAAKAFVLLLKELKTHGPYRFNWPNYTKMHQQDNYHYHLKKREFWIRNGLL